MRIFYLIGALLLTIIILIVSFQNFSAMCTNVYVFFTPLNQTSPTFIIFAVALIGMLAGAFYFGFIQSFFSGGSSEDENSGTDEGF